MRPTGTPDRVPHGPGREEIEYGHPGREHKGGLSDGSIRVGTGWFRSYSNDARLRAGVAASTVALEGFRLGRSAGHVEDLRGFGDGPVHDDAGPARPDQAADPLRRREGPEESGLFHRLDGL